MRLLFWRYSAYQSECSDHRLQERHWVSDHWCKQAGQTPPVSNVFHCFPQVQNHLSSLRGDQPQSGQRMRGSDGSLLFSSSSSRSETVDEFEMSATRLGIPQPKSQFCLSAISTGCEHSASSFTT